MTDKFWTWDQSQGKLYNPEGKFQATGYSGAGIGINNPALQDKVKVGPIPRGMWRFTAPFKSSQIGPYALALFEESSDFTQRSLFRIHGDNAKGDKSASWGCIILPRNVREIMWNSGVHLLKVVE